MVQFGGYDPRQRVILLFDGGGEVALSMMSQGTNPSDIYVLDVETLPKNLLEAGVHSIMGHPDELHEKITRWGYYDRIFCCADASRLSMKRDFADAAWSLLRQGGTMTLFQQAEAPTWGLSAGGARAVLDLGDEVRFAQVRWMPPVGYEAGRWRPVDALRKLVSPLTCDLLREGVHGLVRCSKG